MKAFMKNFIKICAQMNLQAKLPYQRVIVLDIEELTFVKIIIIVLLNKYECLI